MSFELINHLNSPGWTEKNLSLGNTSNGAKTYSEAITKWYAPIFESVYKDRKTKVLLLTVTMENHPIKFNGYDKIFLFLHECSWYRQPVVPRAKAFARKNSQSQVTFLVWNEDTKNKLVEAGLDAEFIPMGIDLEEVLSHKTNVPKYDKRLIYFGNLRRTKIHFFKYFKAAAQLAGWEVDYISASKLNGGEKMNRDEVLKELQKYKYGIGVGICAHEMAALGLKVILFAYNFRCNCPYTKDEALYYVKRNLCSDNETKIPVPDALRDLDKMEYFPPVDIKSNQLLVKRICLKRLK